MRRLQSDPRPEWKVWAESLDYSWHSEGGACSWNEGVAYLLTSDEVEILRVRADEVHAMCLTVVEKVVRENLWSRLGIRTEDVPLLRLSWERREWSLTGRFDFMLDAQGEMKLIEYNAESALTLIETAKVQRAWLKEAMPDHKQFNTLRESLVAAWRGCGVYSAHAAWRPRHREVEATMRFMAGTMREAGIKTTLMAMHCLGWESRRGEFVDGDGQVIECCAKLYPWAWMLEERFAAHVPQARCRFVEPAWRHLLGAKGLLVLLWEQFPGHPALLPAFDDDSRLEGAFVSKPLFGREGHNITIRSHDRVMQQSSGDFEGMPVIHQQLAESPRFDGCIPQFGVWMVEGRAVALGMRETESLIIDGDSPFTPHAVERMQPSQTT